MHSKWKVWDYLKSHQNGIDKTKSVFAFSCFDPLAFSLIKDSIPKSFFSEEKLTILMGREITTSWLDDNFLSMGLFGNSDSFLIFKAEEMPKEVKDKIVDDLNNFILNERYFILNFYKEDAFFKRLQKIESIETIKIQEPAFWEYPNLLNLLCEKMSVFLAYNTKDYIVNKVSSNIASYYSLLSQIKINYPDDENIEIDKVSPLILESKIDHFEMATLFGGKKIKDFYSKLVDSEMNYAELHGLFFFMQSHLMKVLDPSYTSGKKKLTKYDRQIISQSTAWTPESLNRSINYFNKLEIFAKKKHPFLKENIRRDFLRMIL